MLNLKLQYFGHLMRRVDSLEKAWRAAIHGVAKSWTWLSIWTELNWTCCFDYCSFVVCSQGAWYLQLYYFFLLKIALTIRGLLLFYKRFRIIYPSSVKDVMGLLIGIELNLWITLGNMDNLTILILPIKEHGIFFTFFVLISSLTSFISVFHGFSENIDLLSPWCCCSVAKLYHTLCNPMNCSMSGFPVLHYLPEFAQTHVHRVCDAIQPSHPLSPSSPLALRLS